MRKGKQTTLGGALEKLSASIDRASGGGYRQARAAAVWDEVAGEAVASHTSGAHLHDGQLAILVDSPAWATQLSALSEKYREAMNEALGKELVKTVRFSVSRKVQERRRYAEMERQTQEFYAEEIQSIPLTEVEKAQVEASAQGIEDEELREAVVRATIANLEWQKGLERSKSRETAREGA